MENKRQIPSAAKSKPPPIDWNTVNKSRKRGPNRLNSPINATRIQQLYNSHNSKPTPVPTQRKTTQGSTTSQMPAKSASVTNRRRKSELHSPNGRSTEPVSAAVRFNEHLIRDNEYQLQEEEVNSVPLHTHRFKFQATPNEPNYQMVAVKQPPPVQIQQAIVTSVPNATPNLPRSGAAKSNQSQIVYQQQTSAPKLSKETPTAVDNSNQSNGSSQYASHKNSHVMSTISIAPTTATIATTTATTTTTTQRIPPKINILSQQTITKNNINFVSLADNKIIMKPDSPLANAFKSQKIQMIPGQMSSPASSSSSLGATKMHPQNNLIIRGTSQRTMHPKIFSVPLNSNHHQNAQAFYVNMPTKQSPTSNASIPADAMHIIEKVVAEETPVEIMAAETDDYIIDETTGTDDTAAYVTATTRGEPTPAKRAKLSNAAHRAHDDRQRTSFVTQKLLSNASQQYRSHVANNELVSTIIYEEHPNSTEWEYEFDYGQDGKPNGNGETGEVVIEDDDTEYHDSNIIYTEEEIIDDENVLQEEYVTTEVFSPNGKAFSLNFGFHESLNYFFPGGFSIQFMYFADNVIEMEIDSVNHAYHDVY